MLWTPTQEEIAIQKDLAIKFFSNHERLLARQVRDLIEEAMGGILVFDAKRVIGLLESLVEDGRLCKEDRDVVVRGHPLRVTEYFLPDE